MAIISPSRLRRSKAHQLKKTQQLIVFQICQDWFALPIQAVARIVSMGETYGDPNEIGASVTVHQGQEMTVLDVGRHVFGQPPHQPHPQLAPSANGADTFSGYLIVAKTLHNTLVGLPVKSQPTIRRVPLSAFNPLPLDYGVKVNIQCVSSLVIEPDRQPLFLLNTELLSQLRPHIQPVRQTVQA